ncbi:MAG: hypothetical protein ALAOOOJD_02559 [bacterium]|nr:hypothetical protein [bacterium]
MMMKPTAFTRWGGVETARKPHLPAMLVIASGGDFFAGSSFHSYPAFFLIFAFVLAALAVVELFQRCARTPPDEATWQEFFLRYQVDIRMAIYRVIGMPPHGHHAHLFDDVLQAFRLRLLANGRQALLSFRGKTDTAARAYLRRIARNVALTALLKEKPQISLEQLNTNLVRLGDTIEDPETLSEQYLLLRKTIDDCLEKIINGQNRERNMLIFKLAIYEGLSPQDIAEIPVFAAMSTHAIEQQVTRIRRKLRKCLRKNKEIW